MENILKNYEVEGINEELFKNAILVEFITYYSREKYGVITYKEYCFIYSVNKERIILVDKYGKQTTLTPQDFKERTFDDSTFKHNLKILVSKEIKVCADEKRIETLRYE